MIRYFVVVCLILSNFCFPQRQKDSLNAIWKDTTKTNDIRINAFEKMIYEHYLFNLHNESIFLIQEMYYFAKKTKNIRQQTRAVYFLACYFSNGSNKKKTARLFRQCLRSYKYLKDNDGIAKSYNAIAVGYREINEEEKAINYFVQSLKYHKLNNNKDKYAQTICLNNIAEAYVDLNQSKTALKYLNEVKEILNKQPKNNAKIRVYYYYNLGHYYANQKKYDQAIKNYDIAINYAILSNDKHNHEKTIQEKGIIYFNQNKLDLSKHCFKQSIDIVTKTKRLKSLMNSYLYLAKIALLQKDYKKVLEYTKIIEKNTIKYNPHTENYRLEALYLTYQVYDYLKQTDKAFYYFEQYTICSDSFSKVELNTKKYRNQLNYEFNVKKLKDSLERKNSMYYSSLERKKEVYKQKEYLFYTLFILVLFFIILWKYFSDNRGKLKANKKISEQNELLIYQKSNEELKANKLYSIIENTEDLVFSTIDLNYFSYLNSSGRKIFGIDNNQWNTTPIADFLDAENYDKIHNTAIKNCLKIGHWQGEIIFKDKDNNDFYTLISMVAQKDNANKIERISVIAQDISKIIKYQNDIKAQNTKLNKVNTELDRFIYSTSHELRTPIISLVSLIEICKDEFYTSDEMFQDLLFKMKDSLKNVENILNDILDFSQSSYVDLKIEKLNIKNSIESYLKSVEFLPELKDVKISLDINDPVAFYNDNFRIQTVLKNLITNAIKYQRKDEPNKYVKISFKCTTEMSTLTVEDNGEGISQQHQAKIFDMFYRASHNSSGTGLGLYMIKQIIEKLHGSIFVDSKLGVGTKFIIQIPNNQPSI